MARKVSGRVLQEIQRREQQPAGEEHGRSRAVRTNLLPLLLVLAIFGGVIAGGIYLEKQRDRKRLEAKAAEVRERQAEQLRQRLEYEQWAAAHPEQALRNQRQSWLDRVGPHAVIVARDAIRDKLPGCRFEGSWAPAENATLSGDSTILVTGVVKVESRIEGIWIKHAYGVRITVSPGPGEPRSAGGGTTYTVIDSHIVR